VGEKAGIIHDLHDKFLWDTNYSNKVMEMKEMGKKEAEKEYKTELNVKSKEMEQQLKNMKDQYEVLIS